MASTRVVNLDQFLKKFKENQQLALSAAGKAISGAANEMFLKIKERTPVGDPSLWNYPASKYYHPGTLKASWQLDYTGRARDEEGKFIPDAQFPSTGALKFNINGGADVKQITIYNAQPYAWRVENGWSTQAPQGMMKITIAEYSNILSAHASRNRV